MKKLALVLAVVSLTACAPMDGQNGNDGSPGPQGPSGPQGPGPTIVSTRYCSYLSGTLLLSQFVDVFMDGTTFVTNEVTLNGLAATSPGSFYPSGDTSYFGVINGGYVWTFGNHTASNGLTTYNLTCQ